MLNRTDVEVFKVIEIPYDTPIWDLAQVPNVGISIVWANAASRSVGIHVQGLPADVDDAIAEIASWDDEDPIASIRQAIRNADDQRASTAGSDTMEQEIEAIAAMARENMTPKARAMFDQLSPSARFGYLIGQ